MSNEQLRVCVETNLKRLLKQEDLDRDLKITIEDPGPKKFTLQTINDQQIEISGTYFLSNLLQLLATAHANKIKHLTFSLTDIYQNPVDQIESQIKKYYWTRLTRRMNDLGLVEMLEDPKRRFEKKRLYVPFDDAPAYTYFKKISLEHPSLNLKVKKLPKSIDSKTHQELIAHPGLLSLSILSDPENGNPFVVPGGRFNELYGWDSYFIIQGLLLSEKYDLALSTFQHLLYEVEHYGKILNANRSYYLSRSQPPLLTSIIRLFLGKDKSLPKKFLEDALKISITEYETVWMSEPRVCENGLSRYFADYVTLPLEVEAGHFDSLIRPFAAKEGLSVSEYISKLNEGKIEDSELRNLIEHDCSMRESGQDTTNRLVGKSAHLNPVDLNSLLYRYEKDIASIIEKHFKGSFSYSKHKTYTTKEWRSKADHRAQLMRDLMWDSKKCMFFDYDFIEKKKISYESVNTFYTLFANLASVSEATQMLKKALPLFEKKGGLVSTTKKSRGPITAEKPLRQWDYPFGWAPHQMIFWEGALDYGFKSDAERLAYKWLYMITKEARDYNGALSEKYDVENVSHSLTAEYGNEGLNFDFVPNGGFGWTNASYLKGLQILSFQSLIALKEMREPGSVSFAFI